MSVLDLVVLGAGPAGLGAAERAARRGMSVTVLERADRVGGASGSLTVDGVRVDHGSHRLHPATDPRIMAHLRGLLGDDLQRRPRCGRIRLAGRWVGFPLRTMDLVRHLPPDFAAGALRDAALSWSRTADEDSFDAHVRAGLGPTMADRFYGPYARKIWGRDPSQLSSEHARTRVSAGSPARMVARIVRGGDPDARIFFYPRHGFGQISEALASAASGAGAQVRLRSAVTAVHPGDDAVAIAVDGGDTLRARQVFSTIPLPVLARLASPQPPPPVRDDAAALTARAMLLVYLTLPVPRWTRFDAHYLPEGWTRVTRVSEPKNYRDGDDPNDRTVLCAEIPCDRDEPLWRAGDDELARIVVTTLGEAGLPAAAPTAVHVERLPSAYPVYDAAGPARLARVEAWAQRLPGVLTFGRQGLFVHDNSHHALAMAWAAVDAIDGSGRVDAGAWERSRAGFRDHVVED